MRSFLIVLCLLVGSVTSAIAQVSVGIGLPGVSIGINVGAYPAFVRVPGYPVYYAPRLHSNYFFYDGMYWVYVDDNWYSAYWYNGPWVLVAPEIVPLFVLRIPVRYYGAPPAYFATWGRDAPPRWDQHWGGTWAQHRSGWDRWDRRSAPAAAPLPLYQRQYSGNRYPAAEQQRVILGQSYRYQPRDAAVRQNFQEHVTRSAPAPAERKQQAAPQRSAPAQAVPQPRERAVQREQPAQQRPAPAQAAPQPRERPAPAQAAPQPRERPAPAQAAPQPRERPVQREQPAPKASPERTMPQGKGASPEPKREEKGREKGEDKK
jgi:hypothetical protein